MQTKFLITLSILPHLIALLLNNPSVTCALSSGDSRKKDKTLDAKRSFFLKTMATLSSMAISCLHSNSRNESFYRSHKSSQFSKPLFINPYLKRPRFSISFCLEQSDRDERQIRQESGREGDQEEEEEDYWVLTAVRSRYNEIVIVDTVSSRYLLLDSTKNVHSVINKGGQNWTDSYWDEFASLPPIIPDGPIAIYGLGGGTAARLILELWPSMQLEGWEIDQILIEKARDYFGLSELEKPTSKGGKVCVHVDDALSPSQDVTGRYAGIIVDLFSDGKVLEQLRQVPIWLDLATRLMPNGRIMVNCAGIETEQVAANGKPLLELDDSVWKLNSTIKILSEAFPGLVCWKRTPESQGFNFLALTGGLPDLSDWSNKVPDRLSEGVKQWKLCESI